MIHTSSGNVYAPGLEARGLNQRARVRQGLNSGSINQSELGVLKDMRSDARQELAGAKGDNGWVGPVERRNLHQDLNAISRTISAFKQTAPTENGGGSGPLGEKESFESRIWGDPHFEMQGTVNGEQVDAKFDNHDLGNRTQFAGAGFKLETETVAWGAGNGTAVVGSSTVTTGFGKGKSEVTVNADGSVLVDGGQVTLAAGETTQLNKTSTLSMGEDGKYTVSSRNGKVTNTFEVNEHDYGNYINIDSSVNDVQTVGWFQNQV